MIISDLPPEEGADWIEAGANYGVDTVFLLAPTSDETRLQSVAQSASGFIYAVARLGVTGARDDVPPEIGDLIGRIRAHSPTPICAGLWLFFSSANSPHLCGKRIGWHCCCLGVD